MIKENVNQSINWEKLLIGMNRLEEPPYHYAMGVDPYVYIPIDFEYYVKYKSGWIDDKFKILSTEEVKNRKDICDMFIDNILPFAYLTNNIYIVYIIDEKIWAKFDVKEKKIFKKNIQIKKYFKKYYKKLKERR